MKQETAQRESLVIQSAAPCPREVGYGPALPTALSAPHADGQPSTTDITEESTCIICFRQLKSMTGA